MPSILIELGFISTPEEERYLNSEEGGNTLANGIYNAFLIYKNEQGSRTIGKQPEPRAAAADPLPAETAAPTPAEPVSAPRKEAADEGLVFKIQFLTSDRLLKPNDKRLKGLKGVEHYRENGIYKYTYGASPDYNKVLRTRRSVTPLFHDAFIIAFKNGKKMNINAAINEFKKNRNKK